MTINTRSPIPLNMRLKSISPTSQRGTFIVVKSPNQKVEAGGGTGTEDDGVFNLKQCMPTDSSKKNKVVRKTRLMKLRT